MQPCMHGCSHTHLQAHLAMASQISWKNAVNAVETLSSDSRLESQGVMCAHKGELEEYKGVQLNGSMVYSIWDTGSLLGLLCTPPLPSLMVSHFYSLPCYNPRVNAGHCGGFSQSVVSFWSMLKSNLTPGGQLSRPH